MRRLVHEAAEDDARDGSRWLELQVDPTSYAVHLGGLTPTLEIIQDAARNASAATGVDIVLIVAASRMRHPLDARTLARLAALHAGGHPGGVVGFGLSNDERRGTHGRLRRAFRIARSSGLASVPHSGELLGPDHVRTTLDHLAPDRIGHGVRSVEDRAGPRRRRRARHHPRGLPRQQRRAGRLRRARPACRCARCARRASGSPSGADDPLLFGSRLADQYRFAREQHGFTDEELAELARDSIRGSGPRTMSAADCWPRSTAGSPARSGSSELEADQARLGLEDDAEPVGDAIAHGPRRAPRRSPRQRRRGWSGPGCAWSTAPPAPAARSPCRSRPLDQPGRAGLDPTLSRVRRGLAGPREPGPRGQPRERRAGEDRVGEERPGAPGVVVGRVEHHAASPPLGQHRLASLGQRHPLAQRNPECGSHIGVPDGQPTGRRTGARR